TTTTIALLGVGTIGFFLTEYHNPDTLAPLSLGHKILAAWFQSVTPRTAGFNTIDIGKMTEVGLFITMILMFIGASPGSTGGGIKTTTFFLLLTTTKSILEGRENVYSFQRQIPSFLILKTIAVIFGSATVVAISAFLVEIFNPDIDFLKILFESISAFATVGLSTGITAKLSAASKLVIIATMYIGRVGVLLLMSAIIGDPKPRFIKYPEGNLLVG
ncbi:MAG: potassium transporter TrkG, partial [Microcoleaceae cyanobacterium]